MSFSFDEVFATVASVGDKAASLAAKATAYIKSAQAIGAQSSLSPLQKLEAVKDALVADYQQTDAAFAQTLTNDWNAIAGAVSGAYQLLKAGELLVAAIAPAVVAIEPAAAPVVAAVEAGEAVVNNVVSEATEVAAAA